MRESNSYKRKAMHAPSITSHQSLPLDKSDAYPLHSPCSVPRTDLFRRLATTTLTPSQNIEGGGVARARLPKQHPQKKDPLRWPMSKRHKPNLDRLKGASSKPSTSSATRTEQHAQSVHERLASLRLAQAPKATPEDRQRVIDAASQKTVPPSIGAILGVPAAAPPPPKSGARLALRSRWRTPGPAAPRSWAAGSGSRGSGPVRGVGDVDGARRRGVGLGRFLHMMGADGGGSRTVFDRRGLTHLALKLVAENWAMVVEDAPECVAALPGHLRDALPGYLAVYCPLETLSLKSLKIIWEAPMEMDGGASRADVTCLDLSGLAGWAFSMSELTKYLSTARRKQSPAHSPTTAILPAATTEPRTAESWEDEPESATTTTIPTALTPTTTRFPHLTHLSLSHPPPSIS
ncbi:hypothetical protein LTR28_006666, partial [Elasticomyces elasticus]